MTTNSFKPLTAEGRFECGLDDAMRGKVWAFVAVVGEHHGARLGAAVANEDGYTPIPEWWAHADYLAEMQTHADALNAAMGLSTSEAARIIASTMGGMRYHADNRHALGSVTTHVWSDEDREGYLAWVKAGGSAD